MKYHLDTIPLWDAAKTDSECLLCALERRMELSETERYLGASVMEPDVRIQVNAKGFCRRHHTMLFGMSNRLGHALMLESHMIENRQRLNKIWETVEQAGDQLESASVGDRLSGRARGAKETVIRQAKAIREMADTCVLCDTLNDHMHRYLHTFFHLYRQDGEFRKKFQEGKGLCIPHTGQLLEAAAEELSAKELGAFAKVLAGTERENLDRIQEDISWFIKKFDYRYEQEDWKNSRDAVERTVNKTRGWCVGKELNPET